MESLFPVKGIFILLQAGILIGVALLFMRRGSGSGSSSQFGVREADRDRDGGMAPGSPTQARSSRPEPLRLAGIRLDGPSHEILGIAPDSSRAEIQKAYRDRMKQYHPDLVGPPGSREWTDAQKIAEAINRAKEEMLKRTRL